MSQINLDTKLVGKLNYFLISAYQRGYGWQVELALEDKGKPIGVSDYELMVPQ